jgi:hypothetical protein
MKDTYGRDTISSKEYTNILHVIEEHATMPQTPEGNASLLDEFETPQESHDVIPWTDCAETAPNNPTDTPLVKLLFDNPSGASTEGTDKISGPTETVMAPPMNRSQPKPTSTSPHNINLAQQMKYCTRSPSLRKATTVMVR